MHLFSHQLQFMQVDSCSTLQDRSSSPHLSLTCIVCGGCGCRGLGLGFPNSCYIVELWVSATWLCLTQRNTHTCVSKKWCSNLILIMCRVGWAAGSDGLRWLCCVSASLRVSAVHVLWNTFNWLAVCTSLWMWQRQGSAAGLLQWLNVPAN